MPDLAQFQSEVALALLRGHGVAALGTAAEVHRGTIQGGLANALRLDFPTVDWLGGERFFDQAAHAYFIANPPRRTLLDGLGEAFAAFLQAYGPAQGLPYLADVARFDLAVAEAGACAVGVPGAASAVGEGVTLTLDASLAVLVLAVRADLIRDAMTGGGEDALDLHPGDYAFAVWRGEQGACVRPISPGPAALLGALLAGASVDTALDRLIQAAGQAGLAALQPEVFTAPFARLSHLESGRSIP